MKKYVLNTDSFEQMLFFESDYDIAQRHGTIEVAAEDYANFIAEQTAHFVEALMKEMECVEPLSFEEMVELYGSYYDEKGRQYTVCPECGGSIYKLDWESEGCCCDCGYTENEEDY
jgi:hypothetical protein